MKFLENSQLPGDQTLLQPPEQNRLEATRTRSVSARDAPGLCSTTWSTRLTRSYRAHNPSEPDPARERAAAGGDDDALGSCKSRRHNSPSRTPTKRRQPAARTKATRPAGRAMRQRFECAFVYDYSQELATIPIVPHLDAIRATKDSRARRTD